jgi:hypothetical protein
MDFSGLDEFISAQKTTLKKGPIAIIFVEDAVEVESTLEHHLALGFKKIYVLAQKLPDLAEEISNEIMTVYYGPLKKHAVRDAINTLMPHMGDAWVYTCFNAEYLFSIFRNAQLCRIGCIPRRRTARFYIELCHRYICW